jgi:hypothetical protein
VDEPFTPVGSRRDVKAGLGQAELGHLSDGGIVLDDQDSFVHASGLVLAQAPKSLLNAVNVTDRPLVA